MTKMPPNGELPTFPPLPNLAPVNQVDRSLLARLYANDAANQQIPPLFPTVNQQNNNPTPNLCMAPKPLPPIQFPQAPTPRDRGDREPHDNILGKIKTFLIFVIHY